MRSVYQVVFTPEASGHWLSLRAVEGMATIVDAALDALEKKLASAPRAGIPIAGDNPDVIYRLHEPGFPIVVTYEVDETRVEVAPGDWRKGTVLVTTVSIFRRFLS